MAAGVPDELFWRSTPCETAALVERLHERDAALNKAANLRAGLIASAIYNVHGGKDGKGRKAFKPEDFLVEKEKPKILTPEQMDRVLMAWATRHNRMIKA